MKKSKIVNYEIQGGVLPEKWVSTSGWSWRMNDSQIAKHLGISRQAVWSYRKLAKAPKSPNKGIQEGTYRKNILALGETIKTKTTSEIAVLVGCSRGRVAYVLKEAGLQPAAAVRETTVKFPDVNDLGAWAKTNEELAIELETTPGYVSLYRWRKGKQLLTKNLHKSKLF